MESLHTALKEFLDWTQRLRIPTFVEIQRSIVKYRPEVLASIDHGLSYGGVIP